MFKRIVPHLALVAVTVVLTSIFQPLSGLTTFGQTPQPQAPLSAPQAQQAQPSCQTFKETGKAVCGKFLDYWQKNGGLPQQGFPISGEFVEVSDLNGKPYTVQYFERAVFELHPENAPPYDVLLSQLGTYRYKGKILGEFPAPVPVSTAEAEATRAAVPTATAVPPSTPSPIATR